MPDLVLLFTTFVHDVMDKNNSLETATTSLKSLIDLMENTLPENCKVRLSSTPVCFKFIAKNERLNDIVQAGQYSYR